jgi:hypothetical protein
MPRHLSVSAVVSKGRGTVLRKEGEHSGCENVSPCTTGSNMFVEHAMCKWCAHIWLLLKVGIQVCRHLYCWQNYPFVCGEGFYTSCCSRHCSRITFQCLSIIISTAMISIALGATGMCLFCLEGESLMGEVSWVPLVIHLLFETVFWFGVGSQTFVTAFQFTPPPLHPSIISLTGGLHWLL